MASIRFPCPNCSKQLSAPSDLAGKASRCRCGAAVVVPSVPGKPAFDFDLIPTATLTPDETQEPIPRRRRRRPEQDEPQTVEQLLAKIAREGVKQPSASAKTATIVAWVVCGGFLFAAWGSMRSMNGMIGVGEIAYAILIALTGYIGARIVEQVVRAIG